MNEKQAMAFLVKQTKRYAHVIAGHDNVKVVFVKSLGRYAGDCAYGSYKSVIRYCRTNLLANLENPAGLTNLAIHECCHLVERGHGPRFHALYDKWKVEGGKDIHGSGRLVPKAKRGAGKSLEGKWKVEYTRYERVPSDSSPTGYAIRCIGVKEKAMTKTQALKIFRMACSKDYPAWLFQYVSSSVAHGWKLVERHESKKGGQRN